MDTGLATTLIIVGVVVVILIVLAVYVWMSYRSLLALKGNVDEAWGEVAAQMQRRAELIPSIVDTVEQYATHEQKIFAQVNTARSATISAADARAASEAEGNMQKALRSVISVAEGYPQLHASQTFLELQSELGAAEDKLQSARRHYNGGVREYNTKVKAFPTAALARRWGLSEVAFFESAERSAVAQPPRVQF